MPGTERHEVDLFPMRVLGLASVATPGLGQVGNRGDVSDAPGEQRPVQVVMGESIVVTSYQEGGLHLVECLADSFGSVGENERLCHSQLCIEPRIRGAGRSADIDDLFVEGNGRVGVPESEQQGVPSGPQHRPGEVDVARFVSQFHRAVEGRPRLLDVAAQEQGPHQPERAPAPLGVVVLVGSIQQCLEQPYTSGEVTPDVPGVSQRPAEVERNRPAVMSQ